MASCIFVAKFLLWLFLLYCTMSCSSDILVIDDAESGLICNKFILWSQEQLLSLFPSCKVHGENHSDQHNTKPLETQYTAALLLHTAETAVSLGAHYSVKGGGEISRLKCCIQKTQLLK